MSRSAGCSGNNKSNNSPKRSRQSSIRGSDNPFGIRITRYEMHNTLQGWIHFGEYDEIHSGIQQQFQHKTTIRVVIKETFKELVKRRMSKSGQKVHENFFEERRILIHLSNQQDSDIGICRIVNNYIWEDSHSYFYAMQYCKSGLFEYIQHEFDKEKTVEWLK